MTPPAIAASSGDSRHAAAMATGPPAAPQGLMKR